MDDLKALAEVLKAALKTNEVEEKVSKRHSLQEQLSKSVLVSGDKPLPEPIISDQAPCHYIYVQLITCTTSV